MPGEAPAAQRELSYLERAVEVFNSSEYPRRVAGVARSLGAPQSTCARPSISRAWS